MQSCPVDYRQSGCIVIQLCGSCSIQFWDDDGKRGSINKLSIPDNFKFQRCRRLVNEWEFGKHNLRTKCRSTDYERTCDDIGSCCIINITE